MNIKLSKGRSTLEQTLYLYSPSGKVKLNRPRSLCPELCVFGELFQFMCNQCIFGNNIPDRKMYVFIAV